MKTYCVWLLAWVIVTAAFQQQGQAGLILNASGHAVAVTGLSVDGLLYDVTFHVGSYDSVYGSSPDPDPLPVFDGNAAGAIVARPLIVNQLNANGVSLVADSTSLLTADAILIPTLHTDTFLNARWTGISPPPPWGMFGILGINRSDTTAFGRKIAFARFKPASTAPEPETLLLATLAGLLSCCHRHSPSLCNQSLCGT